MDGPRTTASHSCAPILVSLYMYIWWTGQISQYSDKATGWMAGFDSR